MNFKEKNPRKKIRRYTISEWADAALRHTPQQLSFSGQTPADFKAWQDTFRREFRQLLGLLPEQVPLRASVLQRRKYPTHILEKVVFDSERWASVPAWVAIPAARKKGQRFPAVVCCHGHSLGKNVYMGLDSLEKNAPMEYHKNLGIRLAQAGYIAIAPDWRGFGERREPPETCPAADICSVGGVVAQFFGYNLLTLDIWDGMRTIDYLTTRDDVDLSRLGCVGVSLGGTMTMFLSAADKRVSAACISGYLDRTANSFRQWGVCGSQTLPGLLRWGDRAEVAGLICPRPLLIQVGEFDSVFFAKGALREYRRLKRIYRAAGAGDRLALDLFDGCHEIHVQPVLDWFDSWLKK